MRLRAFLITQTGSPGRRVADPADDRVFLTLITQNGSSREVELVDPTLRPGTGLEVSKVFTTPTFGGDPVLFTDRVFHFI